MIVDLGVLYGLAVLAFWIWAVFDSITSPADGVRNLPKGIWVLIVLLSIILGPLMWLGAVAWMVLGRPTPASVANRRSGSRTAAGESGLRPRRDARRPHDDASGSGGAGKRPPIGPDDDPDFLRRI